MSPTVYTANVTRDGRWWMIHVPELDALTQARRQGEVPQQARDLIAVVLDVKPGDVAIDVHYLLDD